MRVTRAIILSALIIQTWFSIVWIHNNAARLAPVQAMRADAGRWLEANADRSRPVLSDDIGAIAYYAPHMRFIDLMGLTSRDALEAYKAGESADMIIKAGNPEYAADTFDIDGNKLVYNRFSASFIDGAKPSEPLNMELVWVKGNGGIAIAIARIK